jgi:hypothetical protein
MGKSSITLGYAIIVTTVDNLVACTEVLLYGGHVVWDMI